MRGHKISSKGKETWQQGQGYYHWVSSNSHIVSLFILFTIFSPGSSHNWNCHPKCVHLHQLSLAGQLSLSLYGQLSFDGQLSWRSAPSQLPAPSRQPTPSRLPAPSQRPALSRQPDRRIPLRECSHILRWLKACKIAYFATSVKLRQTPQM